MATGAKARLGGAVLYLLGFVMFFITVAAVAIKLIADGGTDFPPLAWLAVVAASGLMLVGHTLLYRNRPASSHLTALWTLRRDQQGRSESPCGC